MALNLSVPESTELRPRILVFGVGGAGGNAVNNMIDAELEGVDFAVANTDAQAISRSKAQRRIQLGASITEGLGAG
ncbi:MAG TPA: cell division protein FtsZ, partial [Alphaproteobacteria bacterium]|nr:cell division protein FtsZ [Alphaproteobacteria bacterium]